MFRRSLMWAGLAAMVAGGLWFALHRESVPAVPAPTAAPLLSGSSPAPAAAGTNQFRRADGTYATPADRAADFARCRVSNTAAPLHSLLRNDAALLLENATLDTARPAAELPAHLRANGDPGAYLVQARGPVDDAFRARLREAGATLVSYIPNNAWLVRLPASRAAWLATQPEVRAALPYEPFYKLKSTLLPLAVDQQPLPAGTFLNVMLFGDDRNATREAVLKTGANILSESPSPFGPVLQVSPAPDSLARLAGLPGVQLIERAGVRTTANDLSRVKLRVAVNTTNANNYLGLTGSNVVVNVTDSGVDATHPDLTGRVTGDVPAALIDLEGHGTHVAGIIAASGVSSSSVTPAPPGSVLGASFRGKAPAARIFSLDLGVSRLASLGEDAYAQETIARTNVFISNNSWGVSGGYDYDIFSASYDAAVRDALPGVTGSQPVLFVFAAGNDGGGNALGLAGFAGTVLSPGTAKNVVTVGALEQLRNITNTVLFPPNTNRVAIWQGGTDTDYQVANYSSRGNVGIGIESDYGRFKPDVVAPGTFVISTRSGQWDTNAYYSITNTLVQRYNGLTLARGELAQYSAFVPAEAISLRIYATHRPEDTNAVIALPIYVREGDTPTTADFLGNNQVSLPPDAPLNAPGQYFYAVGNPTNTALTFDLRVEITVTNNLEDYYNELRKLNNALGDKYRYESGTSMAAPGISGVLALMQEYYEQRVGRTNSPALMKALLINGARTVAPIYNLQVQSTVNHQGWGLPALPNCVIATNSTAGTAAALFDQSTTNTLTTGQSVTRNLTLANGATTRPLRVTLVWTDPPGNPAAGLKLVNDLDLVVTNLDTGDVYFGNDIGGSDFNQPWDTNSPPNVDSVNNVENVFIAAPLGTNYSITVRAPRVNVNAVHSHPNGIAQDFALVVTSGNGEIPAAFTVADNPAVTAETRNLTVITNVTVPVPLLRQTVGANSQFLVSTNGATNQWHFYVITNTTGFTNAAFLTFLPPTLATPRLGVRAASEDEISRVEADIDLYVSRDPGLTNLESAALAGALKSVGRGGTEVIAISSNDVAAGNPVFYIGVKSEDQMAAEYAFFAGFSELPFSEEDAFGNLYLRGFPAPVEIPDGSPANPGAAFMFGIATQPIQVRKVIVTNTFSHQSFGGDLLGNLSHNNQFAVLNNHSSGNGFEIQTRAYDDSGEDPATTLSRTDGPGSLRNFVGEEGVGLWLLTMIDDAPSLTGSISNLIIKIEPNTLDEGTQLLTVPGFGWAYATIEVPVEATNLVFGLDWPFGNALPVDLYVRRGDFPTFTEYDKKATVVPPGGTNVLSIGKGDLPPLQAGTYYVGVYNPNAQTQVVRLTARLELDVNGVVPSVFSGAAAKPLLDDAVTTDSVSVTNLDTRQKVISVEANLRIKHPRVADLAVQLAGPGGQRVLLIENRGALDANGLGGDVPLTNTFAPVNSAGGPQGNTNTIDTLATSGIIRINYDFQTIPDTLTVYYQSNALYGPTTLSGTGFVDVNYAGTSSLITIIVNEGGSTNPATFWSYTAESRPTSFLYTTFTEDTNKTTTPIKFAAAPFTSASTNLLVWDGGFEGSAANALPTVGQVFPAGWFVNSGSVDVLLNTTFGLATDSGNVCIDLNGNGPSVISTNVAVTPGTAYVFSFAWSRNPDSITFGTGIPSASVSLDGVPVANITANLNNSWAALNWQRQSVPFVATGTNLLVSFQSTTPGSYGVMLDSVRITQAVQASGIYLPEEPLTGFKGQRAKGEWQLEVWDRRTGATNPTPELTSWNLSFIFETVPISAIALEHATPVTVDIPPGGMQYFTVDVPAWALFATNTLVNSSAGVSVYFNQGAAPKAAVPPDTLIIGPNVTSGVTNLSTTGTPPLRPGQRYYLGITNNTITTATVTYRVDYDITALTNNVPFTGTMPGNGIPRYFSYDISSNATAVLFGLTNLNGDLNLVARRGALPTLQNNTYASLRPGNQDEQIILLPGSTPVPLSPGVWFLGVYNATTAPVNYDIYASELTNTLPAIVTLTNAIPYNTTNGALAGTAQFYRYPVTTAAARVQFETFGADGDVTLVAKRGLPLPDLATFDYRSARAGTNNELIVILTNSVPVTLTSGDWFLAAVKISSGAVGYNIKATEWPQTGRPVTLLSAEIVGGTDYCLTWTSLPGVYYYIEGRTNFFSPVWVQVSPTIEAVDYTTTWCTPWPTPYGFFRIVEGIAPAPVAASPTTITSIVRGPGGVTINWFGPIGASYEVQWSDTLFPAVWNSFAPPQTSGTGAFSFTDDGSQTGGFSGTRFYRVVQLP